MRETKILLLRSKLLLEEKCLIMERILKTKAQTIRPTLLLPKTSRPREKAKAKRADARYH